MSKFLHSVFALAIVGISLFVTSPTSKILPVFFEEDESSVELELEQLPKDVQEVILAAAGGNSIASTSVEFCQGATVYEAEWNDGEVENEIVVAADGSVLEHENSIRPEQAPHSVQAIAKKLFAANEQVRFEKKTVVVYELEAVRGGRERSVILSPVGKKIEIESEPFDMDAAQSEHEDLEDDND